MKIDRKYTDKSRPSGALPITNAWPGIEPWSQRWTDVDPLPELWPDTTQSCQVILRPTVSRQVQCCRTQIWGPWPDCYYCRTCAGLLLWGALSDERTGL
jgi:hypothetical protein